VDFDAVLKGRKHEQSQKPWDTDFTVQSRNKAYKQKQCKN